jgi:hypothetical protein
MYDFILESATKGGGRAPGELNANSGVHNERIRLSVQRSRVPPPLFLGASPHPASKRNGSIRRLGEETVPATKEVLPFYSGTDRFGEVNQL